MYYHHIVKDLAIIDLSLNKRDGFEKRSDRMVAFFEKKVIPKLLKHLEKVHSMAVVLSRDVYEQYVSKNAPVKVKTDLVEKAEKEYEKDLENFEERKRNQQKAELKPAAVKKDISLIKLKMKMKAKAIEMQNL
jgi:hypothetical protein